MRLLFILLFSITGLLASAQTKYEYAYRLLGRQVVDTLSNKIDKSLPNGRVRLTIRVNPGGKIMGFSIISSDDIRLKEATNDLINEIRFDSIKNAPKVQFGEMAFTFKNVKKKKDHKVSNKVSKEWEKANMDSSEFVRIYGTDHDYKFQNSLMRRSIHHHLVLLIGAHSYWLNELSVYLQDNGFNPDFEIGKGYQKYIFSEKSAFGHPPLKIILIAKVSNDIIKKVTISGPADYLIDLFIKYWGLSSMSLNDLKSQGIITKEFISDKIIFKWQNANPDIIITKNPSVTVLD